MPLSFGEEFQKSSVFPEPALKQVSKIDKYLLDMLQKPELSNNKVVVIVTLSDQSQNEISYKIKLEYETKILPYKENIKKIVKGQKERENERFGKVNKSLSRDEEIVLFSNFTPEENQEIKSNSEIIEQYINEMRNAIKNNSEYRRKKAHLQEPVISEIKNYKGKILGENTGYNSLIVEMPLKHVEELASKPEISFISSTIIQSNLTLLDHSTYTIGADILWTGVYPQTSPVYDVAISDTGVDITHPALKYLYDGSTLRNWYQIDFDPFNEGFDDLSGHGTHVSGIVGSSSYAESETIVLSETFEGLFPEANGWSVGDLNSNNGLDYWDDVSYQRFGGSWSGWSAGTGSQSTTITETIFTETFEGDIYDGNNGWSIGDSNSNSGSDYWDETSYTAHSGSKSAWAADIGSYTTTATTTESIFTEGFELPYPFPGSTWTVGDSNSNSGSDYWDDTSYKSKSWFYSGWNAGMGDNSVYGGSNYNNHKYDNYMDAYMYRSVSLSSYNSVTLSYDYWTKSESCCDKLYVLYYDGGWQFKDAHSGDSNGWKSSSYTIPKTASSVGFHFASDYSVVDEGAYIDNLALTGTKTTTTSTPNSDLHLYDDNMDAYMKRTLDLRNYASATLTFWYKMPSREEGYDYGQFKVNGVEIKKYTVEKTAWEQETIDLSAYAGQTITIEWNFHSDVSVRKEGWYIDDITITGTKTTSKPNSDLLQYDDNMDAYMTKQINLGSSFSATLTYNYWVDVEDSYDYLKVQTSTDGTNWVDKKTYSEGYDSKDSDPYAKKWYPDTVDLNSYAGSNVYVRFLFHSDGSYHDREGAYIDNIKVTKASFSTTNYRGVVYDIQSMLNAKWMGTGGAGTQDGARNAIDWAVYDAVDKAEVVSNSWGWKQEWDGQPENGESDLSRFVDSVVDNSYAVLVFAAGNEGSGGSRTLRHPADAYNVITVGASDDKNTNSRSDDILASYSSRGTTDDGRKKPDIIAPGSNILSTAYNYEGSNSDFIEYSGTSMATPHVAGVAVWFMSYGLSPLEVKALLINTAEDKETSGWDENWGWGYLDSNHAYARKDDTFTGIITDAIPNSKVEKYYRIPAYSGDKATLTWNRHIGYNSGTNTYTTVYPLNNLDLYAYDEPNGNFISSSSSGVDNVEQISFSSSYNSAILKIEPFGGSWTWKNEYYALATEENAVELNPPSFSVTVSAPSNVEIGSTFTVSASVTNNGGINAHDAQLTLNLPLGLTIISGSNPASLGTITPAQTKSTSWMVRADTSGTKSVSTSVSSNSYGESFTGTSSLSSINVMNTPVGANVKVELANANMNVLFANVMDSGQTSVGVSTTGTPPPVGFNLAGNYYDLTTSAKYSGNINVCVNYNEAQVVKENTLKLFHFENSKWADVTTSLDTNANIICGTVTSLSEFIAVEPVDITAPTTTAVLSGVPGNNGWNISDVQITLTAADNVGGLGVNKTDYSLDGTNWIKYTLPFAITDEGITTVYYRSTDNAGNVESTKEQIIKIDKTKPGISVSGVSEGSYYSIDVTLVITITDSNLDTQSITLNGVPFVSGTVVSAEGSYALVASATDKAGNSDSKTINFVVDKTKPSIDISGVSDGNYYNLDVTPVITITDSNLDTQSITLNGAPFVSGTVISAEGSYALVASGTDKASNSDSKTLNFVVDKTKPDISISGVSDGSYYNLDVTPIITITDSNLDTQSITLNGAPFTSGTVVSVEGSYALVASGTDKAGNSNSKTVNFVVDKTKPDISISGVTESSYYGSDVTPVIAIMDSNLDTQSITLNGAPFTSGTVVSAEGNYALIASGTDKAGNSDSKTVNFVVDKTKPSISISGVTDGSYYNLDVTPVITITDANLDTSSITFNGAPFVSGTVVSAEGSYALIASATDKAGNSGSKTVNFVVDKTKPDIGISGISDGNYYNLDVTPVITITDSNLDTQSITLNGAPYTSGTVVSAEGSYTLVASGTDKAGNSNSKPVNFIMDKTKPDISISGVSDGSYYNIDVTPVIIITDSNLDTQSITLNGAPFVSGTVISAEGSYTLVASGTDKAGNSDSKPVNFVVDKTKPAISISGVSDGSYYNTDVTPVITITDSNLDIQSITLNGAPFVSGTVISAEGSYTLVASGTDKAGNSASFTVTGINIDKTLPSVTVTRSPDANANGWNNGSVTVTFTATDGLSGIDGSSTESETLASEGANQGSSRTFTDKAGNSVTGSISNINIDLTPPTITGVATTSPNANGWYNSDVVVHFTATDSGSGVDTVTPDTTLSTEGKDQSVTGTVMDKAGNAASVTVSGISIDKTPPSIAGTRTPAANSNGWNNVDVSVHFDCSDTLSGLDTCTPDSVVSSEGAGQSVSGTATDKAGNSASAAVSNINIDKTSPTITGAATTLPNANGWYNSDVAVHFTATDSGSGVDTVTPDTTLSTEGSSQSVTGTIVDKAGNSASTTVSGISIDKTAPTIAGSRSPSANANGWNNADVSVHFDCSDTLSGLDACTPDSVVSSEGAGQSVSGTATDKAGNAASASVSDINIDKTAPGITGSATTLPNANGWYNSDVAVHFTATDSGSGVDTVTPDITLSTEGKDQSVTGTVMDKAGNAASVTVSGISIDKTPPSIAGTRTPAANSNGWNNVDVSVHFDCSDTLSGLDTCTPDSVVSSEGAGQSVSGTATDKAGNSASAAVSNINIDKTSPTITGAATTLPNANGWYNSDVVVSFAGSDALSGVDTLTPDTTLSTEGSSQSVTGTIVDKAGNSASFVVSGISIDKTPPSIAGSRSPTANANGWNNADVTVHFDCTDALSGLDTCTPDSVVSSEGAGQSASGTATDKAGNTASAAVSNINIDKTSPTITGVATTLPNANGWYNSDVVVHFTATDSGSGVDTVTPDTTLSTEGKDQSVTGTVMDKAGNSASITVSGISIDKTLPVITINSPTLKEYLHSDSVTVNFDVADVLSGIDSVTASIDNTLVTNGQIIDLTTLTLGEHTLTVQSTDKAGNSGSKSVSFYVKPVPAVVDIKPDTLNKASQSDKNAITVYIEIPGYDVNAIDVGTVTLNTSNGNALAQLSPTEVGDYDSDGIPDRMVKFDRQAVIQIVDVGDKIAITIRGGVKGAIFEGSDEIRVIEQGKK